MIALRQQHGLLLIVEKDGIRDAITGIREKPKRRASFERQITNTSLAATDIYICLTGDTMACMCF